MLTSTVQPRRIVKHAQSQTQSCAACGERRFLRSVALPFCNSCFEWARQRNFGEWDDIGGGD